MGAHSIDLCLALLLAVLAIASAQTSGPQQQDTLIPQYPRLDQHASAPLQQPGYVPRPRWMAGYPHKTLRQLRLPGTHDSGTYAWTLPQRWPFPLEEIGTMVFNLVGDLSRTQTLSIYDQLMAGARVFDLRLAVNPWIVQQARAAVQQYNTSATQQQQQQQKQQQQQDQDQDADVEGEQQQHQHQHQEQPQAAGLQLLEGPQLGRHAFRVLQPPPGAAARNVLPARHERGNSGIGSTGTGTNSSSSSTTTTTGLRPESALAAAGRLDVQLSQLAAYSAQLSGSLSEAELRSSLVLAHSLPGVRWSEALADLSRYMKDNPTEVIVLHIVRATLDANVAGVIDMYPAAWAAAADMLVEALSGARLITLEQAYHTPLHQLWPSAPQGSLLIFSGELCNYGPSPSPSSSSSLSSSSKKTSSSSPSPSSSSSSRKTSSSGSSASSNSSPSPSRSSSSSSKKTSSSTSTASGSSSSSSTSSTVSSRLMGFWWHRAWRDVWWFTKGSRNTAASSSTRKLQQQQQLGVGSWRWQWGQQNLQGSSVQQQHQQHQQQLPGLAAADTSPDAPRHFVTLSPGDLECHSSHLLLESWFNGTHTEYVPDLLQKMIVWLSGWSAAGWPSLSRPTFLLASAQITLEAHTIWELIWNHIGGWAAAEQGAAARIPQAAGEEAAENIAAGVVGTSKKAPDAVSGSSAIPLYSQHMQQQAAGGQPWSQYGHPPSRQYNSRVRTLYEEGVLANQQLLDAVLRNPQVPPSFSMWSMDALDSDLVAAILQLNDGPLST